jgi:endonuclease YncB( thermonuclease family)
MYLLLLPLLLVATEAETFTGKVITVIDGDSIVVSRDKQQIEIRLLEIDCPEYDQAFGSQAKKRTAELCLGKTVTVKSTGKDDYDRILSHVFLPNGKELNRELVRAGLAWWYRKYSKDESLGKLEASAKKDRRGLWSDKEAVAPWDWRAAQRAEADVPISNIKVVPNGIKIVALLPNPKGLDAGNEQVTIANSRNDSLILRGWKLVDRAGNEFALAGTVAAKKSLVLTMTESTMPLNNNGDEILLIDAQKVVRSQVWYTKDQVRSGVTLLSAALNVRMGNRGTKKEK